MRLHPHKADITEGLNLTWNDVELIELTDQIRCQDTRWNDVLQEFRVGSLTIDTPAFLHGKPASVPGSWTASVGCMCQKAACNKLIVQTPKKVLAKECLAIACKEERSRRVRVVKPGDTRLKQDKFKSAVTIVENSDLKYEINGLRLVPLLGKLLLLGHVCLACAYV